MAKPGAQERYTVKQVAKALKSAAGIGAAAANRLKCSPATITNYMQRHPRAERGKGPGPSRSFGSRPDPFQKGREKGR